MNSKSVTWKSVLASVLAVIVFLLVLIASLMLCALLFSFIREHSSVFISVFSAVVANVAAYFVVSLMLNRLKVSAKISGLSIAVIAFALRVIALRSGNDYFSVVARFFWINYSGVTLWVLCGLACAAGILLFVKKE